MYAKLTGNFYFQQIEEQTSCAPVHYNSSWTHLTVECHHYKLKPESIFFMGFLIFELICSAFTRTLCL